MRFVCLAIAFAGGIGLLTAAYAAVSKPGSDQHEADSRSIIAEGCGYGWHWASGHARLDGSWTAGRCQIDR
jgi:hypothetical protein